MTSQLIGDERTGLRLGDLHPSCPDHECRQPLPEVVVRHADHCHIGNSIVREENVLDLLGEHVLTAADNHLVSASGDEQQPCLVDATDVAGRHQAINDLFATATRVPVELRATTNEDSADAPSR